MKRLSLLNWLGLITVVFALIVLTGNNAGAPTHGLPSLLDALGFLLTGVALVMPTSLGRVYRVMHVVAGGALALFGGTELLAILFNLPHVFANGHSLSPNAATAFFLIGVVIFLLDRIYRQWQLALLQFACVGLLALGVFDTAGAFANLTIFYSWYQQTRMPALTAGGVIVLALGFLSFSYQTDWYQRFAVGKEDTRITLIGAVLLLLVALTAGLFGFGILAQQAERTIKNSLALSLESRLRLFEIGVERALNSVVMIAARPRLNYVLGRSHSGDMDATAQHELATIVDNIMATTPVRALVVFDAAGKPLAQRGELVTKPKMAAPLKTQPPARLIWSHELFIQVDAEFRAEGVRVGRVRADVAVPTISDLFGEVAGLGHSGTMAICFTAEANKMQCFPTRLEPQGITAERVQRGQSRPMDYALSGRRGVMSALDVHGENVIAAYAPIGDTGLGMVIKVDTGEMFAPIRTQFQRVLVMLLGLVFVGILLLRWQIGPLVRKLMHEIQERKLAEARLSYLANHDSLTGLPNRTLLYERLQQAMAEARRRGHKVAAMFLDLDRFKIINDTLGHSVGDALLREVAALLQLSARGSDTVARLGGDEFMLILNDIKGEDDAARVASKLREALNKPLPIQGRDLYVTGSIGITLFPDDADNIDALLKNADVAMYRAKEQGRNNYRFYTSEMNARAAERLSLENGLRKALARDEFIVYYQPQIDVRNGTIIGVEALLRWQHPELGFITPRQFISLAEETGLIVPIGEWVLHRACADAKAWQDAALRPVRLAVNFSSQQFRQSDIADTLLRTLNVTGLHPRYLALELTESIFMQNTGRVIAMLRSLHAQGVQIALDDFGTGYSSLSYLKRFPLDTLKIDRSFLRHVTSSTSDAALCTAVIAMAHSLGLQVIAEGVEAAEQLAWLRDAGCDAAQGYYIHVPVDEPTMRGILRDGLSTILAMQTDLNLSID